METLAIIIVVIYAVSLLFIFSYSIIQLNLAITYLKAKAAGKKGIFAACLVIRISDSNRSVAGI